MDLAILPLAITMLAGPQILSAIIFVTTTNPVRVSLAYLAGVTAALIFGLTLWYIVFNVFLTDSHVGEQPSGDSGLRPVQFALIGILIYLAVRTYLQRETTEQPKWLTGLSAMTPARALILGFLLIFLFPSDFIILLTVTATLVQNNESLVAAIPFAALTLLLAALPLLLFALFRNRMQVLMPRVRDWMQTHSWIISIGVYVLFIFLIA